MACSWHEEEEEVVVVVVGWGEVSSSSKWKCSNFIPQQWNELSRIKMLQFYIEYRAPSQPAAAFPPPQLLAPPLLKNSVTPQALAAAALFIHLCSHATSHHALALCSCCSSEAADDGRWRQWRQRQRKPRQLRSRF